LQAIGRGEDHDVGSDGLGAIELDAIAPVLRHHGARRRRDDGECDIAPALDRLEQSLAHIFAEQLPRQEGVRERLMQARLVLALIELTKRPVQKIARLAGANGKVAGAHVEEIERMMAAIGDSTPKRGGSLDNDKAERSLEVRQAGDGGSGASKAAADHAHT
jgi:hypothetical protein